MEETETARQTVQNVERPLWVGLLDGINKGVVTMSYATTMDRIDEINERLEEIGYKLDEIAEQAEDASEEETCKLDEQRDELEDEERQLQAELEQIAAENSYSRAVAWNNGF